MWHMTWVNTNWKLILLKEMKSGTDLHSLSEWCSTSMCQTENTIVMSDKHKSTEPMSRSGSRPTSDKHNTWSAGVQPLSYDDCNHRGVWSTGYRVLGMSHSHFSCHRSSPEGSHRWLTGVSNDSSSEVTHQHKHMSRAQLQATLIHGLSLLENGLVRRKRCMWTAYHS